jgi:acyl-CoA thioesterase
MTVAGLIETMALEPIGEQRYRVQNMGTHQSGGVVFAGQLLGQLAAVAEVSDPAKHVKTVHVLFARAAPITEPLEIAVTPIQSGRTFGSVDLTVTQGDRLIIRALALLSAPEPDFIVHARTIPAVARPEDCPLSDDGFPGRETRIVEANPEPDPQTGVATMNVWMRFPDAPDEPAVNVGLMGHMMAQFSLGVTMWAHPSELSTADAHGSVSVGVMSETITYHNEAAARDWLLVSVESTYSGQARAYSRGDVFRQDGLLVASFVQDGMIRVFDESQAPKVSSATRI